MEKKINCWRKGEITVFVSLMMAVLLIFFQACLESARVSYQRARTEEALELAELSVLSEYQRELFEKYSLFYLDLSYGGCMEGTSGAEERVCMFLEKNLPKAAGISAEVKNAARATDCQGLVFYEQAVSCIRQKTGVSLLENMENYEELGAYARQRENVYQEAEERETKKLAALKEQSTEEEASLPDPTENISAVKKSSILNLVLQEPARLSGKTAELSLLPSKRVNIKGAGARQKYDANAVNDAFFLAYLQEYFHCATDFLAVEEGEEAEPELWLDYQLEYLIGGKKSDRENLEYVCGRLLAIREGINYVYLRSDAVKVAECQTLAAALTASFPIPGLTEAVKQVLMLAWAFGESILDVRQLLGGKKVAFLKTSDSFRLTLSEALELHLLNGEGEDPGDEKGLSYRDYLGMMLTLSRREEKALRSLDVIEGTLKVKLGRETFRMDQCSDSFWVRTEISYGKQWSSERWFCYEW